MLERKFFCNFAANYFRRTVPWSLGLFLMRVIMRKIIYILSVLVIVLMSGCSTKNNTRATRSYHQTKCRYNINYNAMNSYRDGMQLLNSNQNDDYTHPIKMFPISNPANQSLATTQMDEVILKCRKAIKLHSITKKPQKDSRKAKDEKYMYFYNQEEYVQGVKDAWILLGKAELHKGDFMSAIATFNYIIRHYPSDIYISIQAKIWQARAYAEAGWLYEAQQSFEAIKMDDVPRKLSHEYTTTKAFLLLEEKNDAGALPFLQMAVSNEDDKYLRARWNMLIGQILYKQGRKKDAIPYLKGAIQRSRSYQLEFNAKLLLLECEGGSSSITQLEKMAKNVNNKDYLDQVYCAMGNVYLNSKDTAKAIEAYRLGAENSTRNGVEKAALLITMGDLFYSQKKYVDAQPCYSEAVNLITAEHEDYRRISKLSVTLDQLAQYANTIALQDSLQYLSTLSLIEQRAIVDDIIAKQKVTDSIAAAKEKEAATKGFVESDRPNMSITIGSQDWYFYNPQLIAKGQTSFKNKWGNRPLEDNWRRSNKVASGIADMDSQHGDAFDDEEEEDIEKKKDGEEKVENPLYDPEYYLSQIPETPDDIQKSNMAISSAMFSLARLYDEQLEEYQLSESEHEEFQSRFPSDSMNLESLYACYRIGLKTEDEELSDRFRDEIIRRYPNSTYALMLSDTGYVERATRMLAVQDSIYQETYKAYCNNDFKKVHESYQMMLREYPTSSLMDRFAFLDALSLGKAGKTDDFFAALESVNSAFPNSQVVAMSRDILALRSQGEDVQKGKNTTTLADLRSEAEAPEDDVQREFTRNDESLHALVIVLDGATRKQANATLYDIAAYNFTRFMVRTYDLEQRVIDGKETIIVTEFASRSEAEWYFNKLRSESAIKADEFVIISLDDLGIIGKIKTLGEYTGKK